MAEERLQKIIAAAGIASRRKAEELITAGRVQVNGQPVTTLGAKADPGRDHIKVDGKLLRREPEQRHVYILLNKPKGYVTTVSDPEGRPTVMDLVQGVPGRIVPVGRLDYLSEGLLLLTSDGELVHKLTHASFHVPKTYLVKVAGTPTEEQIKQLRGGIRIQLDTGIDRPTTQKRKAVRTAPARIDLVRQAENPWFRVTLIEGRNRQIRRMFEEVGHHVEKIRRVGYAFLDLDTEPGKWRMLTDYEVRRLKSLKGTEEIGGMTHARKLHATAAARHDKKGSPAKRHVLLADRKPISERPPVEGARPRREGRPAGKFGKASAPRSRDERAPRGESRGQRRNGVRQERPRGEKSFQSRSLQSKDRRGRNK